MDGGIPAFTITCIFHQKLRTDRTLLLTYLDSTMAIFFQEKHYFFRIWPSFGGEVGSNLNQKCKFWERPMVVKI